MNQERKEAPALKHQVGDIVEVKVRVKIVEVQSPTYSFPYVIQLKGTGGIELRISPDQIIEEDKT